MSINIHKFLISFTSQWVHHVKQSQLFPEINYIYVAQRQRDNYQRTIYLLNGLLAIPLFFKKSRMERVKSLASGEGNITLAKLSIFRISHQ